MTTNRHQPRTCVPQSDGALRSMAGTRVERSGHRMYETDTIEADQRTRRLRRGLIVLLLGLSVAGLGAGAFSLAIFTDTDASSGSFTAGTVDISTNPTTLFT